MSTVIETWDTVFGSGPHVRLLLDARETLSQVRLGNIFTPLCRLFERHALTRDSSGNALMFHVIGGFIIRISPTVSFKITDMRKQHLSRYSCSVLVDNDAVPECCDSTDIMGCFITAMAIGGRPVTLPLTDDVFYHRAEQIALR